MRGSSRGFTLLEVLVAVAILGLGLTAILSAQFSAVSGVAHARGMSQALGLARCKMSEIEERLARDGFGELDEHEVGECCEGSGMATGYTCEWLVEKPIFPEASAELDLDNDLDLSGSSLGPIQNLADSAKQGKAIDPTQGIGAVTDALGGDFGMAAGGMGGLASMVMGMVYPELRQMFETSTRRVTVIVRWQRGSREYDFDVVQWVTNPNMLPQSVGIDEALDASESDASGRTGGGNTPRGTPAGGRGNRGSRR